MKAYIVYNKRSCVTGKALFDTLSSKVSRYKGEELSWRRNMINSFKFKPEVILRWGESSLSPKGQGYLELNTAEAVSNASNKLKMMKILSQTEGVVTPKIMFPDNLSVEDRKIIIQGAYVRDAYDHVSFRKTLTHNDKYATQPINKISEYRVHIFNGKTIGVYEKVPTNKEDKLWKSFNSSFKRIDVANEANRNAIKGIRPMSVKAVGSLGLLFGGVDIIKNEAGEIFVTEVNSSPALNGPNLERWADEIINYLENYELENNTSEH